MRPIDADALEKDANEDLLSDTDTVEEVYWNDGAKSIIDLIKTAPTIEPKVGCEYWDGESGFCALHRPAEPKRGKWLKIVDLDTVQCSECFEEMEQKGEIK